MALGLDEPDKQEREEEEGVLPMQNTKIKCITVHTARRGPSMARPRPPITALNNWILLKQKIQSLSAVNLGRETEREKKKETATYPTTRGTGGSVPSDQAK
jgi:hypothetical protein